MKRWAVLPILLLVGCGGEHAAPAKKQGAEAAPVAVRAVAVAMEDWPRTYEAVGVVRARTTAPVSARVMGYVRELRVNVGDRVRAGDLLAAIDARDLETGIQKVEAMRQEAAGMIPEADNGIAAARAQLNLAETTFKRMQDLFGKKSISNQEFDEARTRVEAARAQHEMALARRKQIDARLGQIAQESELAKIQRGYAEVRAPFGGLVVEKRIEAGAMATPGTPLLVLERDGAFRLEVPVEESKLGEIRVGSKVTVRLDALDREIAARVGEVVPTIDPSSRAYTVKIDLPAISQVRSGLYGRAMFEEGAQPALSVPAAAVRERGQVQSVFVVEDGVARARLVTTGRRKGDRVEVLSGLSEKETVVAAPPPALADGAKVEVRS